MPKDAKGHGSNPGQGGGRKYRGKYPDNIHTVYGMNGPYRGHALVTTNGGGRHLISAFSTGGRMPRPGQSIGSFSGASIAPSSDEMAAQMLKYNSEKSSKPPTHSAMGGGTAKVRSPAQERIRRINVRRQGTF